MLIFVRLNKDKLTCWFTSFALRFGDSQASAQLSALNKILPTRNSIKGDRKVTIGQLFLASLQSATEGLPQVAKKGSL